MQFCQLFYYYLGSGKLTIGDFSSEQLLHDFDEAHMAFGQVSARTHARANANATNKGPSSAWSFLRFAQRTMKKESVQEIRV